MGESSLADDLRAARALIDTPEKWGRGPGTSSGMCALEAIRQATGAHSTGLSLLPAHPAMVDALPEGSKYKKLRFVGGYNDDPATTHADIMALFDRAIEAAIAKATGAA